MATDDGGNGPSAAKPSQRRAFPSTSQSQSTFVPEKIPPLFPVPDPRTFSTKIPETVVLPFLEEGNELVKKEVARLEADRDYMGTNANSSSYVLNISVVAAHASANLILNKLMLANTAVTAEMDRERKNPLLFRELGIRSIDWSLPMSAETLKFMAGLWLYRFAFQYRSQQRNELASGAVASGDYIRRQLAYFTAQNEPWMQKVGVAMTDWLTRVVSSSSQSYVRLDSIMTSGVKPFIRNADVNAVVKQNTALEQDLEQAKYDIGQLRAALTSLGGKYAGGAQENRSLAEWAQQQADLAEQNEINRSSLIIQLLAPSPAFVTTMLGLSRTPIIITASSLTRDASGRTVDGDDDVLQTRALPGYSPSSALVALMLRISAGGFVGSGRGASGGDGGGGGGRGGGGGGGGSAMDVDDADNNNSSGNSGSAVSMLSSVFPSSSLVRAMIELSTQRIPASSSSSSTPQESSTNMNSGSRGGRPIPPDQEPALTSTLFPSASVVKMMLRLSSQPITTGTADVPSGQTQLSTSNEGNSGRADRPREQPPAAMMPSVLFPSASVVKMMIQLSTQPLSAAAAVLPESRRNDNTSGEATEESDTRLNRSRTGAENDNSVVAVPLGLFPSGSLVRAMLSISKLQPPPAPITPARPPPPMAQRPAPPAERAADPRRLFPTADFVQSMLLMSERARQQLGAGQ